MSAPSLFPDFEQHRVDVGNGISIAAVVGGSGSPLLLLHGYAQTWSASPGGLEESPYPRRSAATTVCRCASDDATRRHQATS
jgi:hypothetical protein